MISTKDRKLVNRARKAIKETAFDFGVDFKPGESVLIQIGNSKHQGTVVQNNLSTGKLLVELGNKNRILVHAANVTKRES